MNDTLIILSIIFASILLWIVLGQSGLSAPFKAVANDYARNAEKLAEIESRKSSQ